MLPAISLHRRLSVFVMLAFGLAALALLALASWVLVKDAQRSLQQRQQTFVQLAARQIDTVLEQRMDALQRLARLLQHEHQLARLTEIQRMFETRVMLADEFNHGLMFLDPTGRILTDAPAQPGRVGFSYGDQPFFRQAAALHRPVISPPFIDPLSGRAVFAISEPIRDADGRLLGVLSGFCRLGDDPLLVHTMARELVGEGERLQLLDIGQGILLASSDGAPAMQLLEQNGQGALLARVRGGGAQGMFVDPQGTGLLYAAQRLTRTDWGMLHLLPEELVLEPVRPLLTRLMVLSALLLGVLGLLSAWYVGRQLRPLGRAAAEIEDMVGGFSPPRALPIEHHDELGSLLASFNRLLQQQLHQADELRKAHIQAEAASHAKSEFLASVGHELRTPLNVLIGLSELQLQEDLPEMQRRRIRQIQQSGRQLLGLVDELLEYARLEVGQLPLQRAPFLLEDVLQYLALQHGEAASAKGLVLLFRVVPGVPTTLLGDALRIGQVLSQLLRHAIESTSHGEVVLEVSLVGQSGDQLSLRFALIDSGGGIAESQYAAWSLAFGQLDALDGSAPAGISLGLAIAQRLAQLMGSGGIQFVSQAEQGCEFSFELPLQQPGSSLAVSADSPLAPGCALICDPNPRARQILVELLQSWHWQVQEAADGESALAQQAAALSSGQTYSLLLVDGGLSRRQAPDQRQGLAIMRQLCAIHSPGSAAASLALLLVEPGRDDQLEIRADDPFHVLRKPLLPLSLQRWLVQASRGDTPSWTPLETRFNGQQVLVVEDNPINQTLCRALLQKLGLQPTVVADGSSAIQILSQGGFDLVLMDIQLPGLDGYQTARRIREFDSGIPIIALTAAALIKDREQALAAGMNDHLAKPVDVQTFQSVLQRWLNGGKARTVALPHKLQPPSAEQRPAAPPPEPEAAQQEAAVRQSVLIVDDMPSNLRLLANGLRDQYEIQVASRGEKALQIALGEHPPDLILLDVLMPEMDGFEVCRALKNDPRTSHIPVIFVSALDSAEDEEKGLRLGAADFISKPFHLPVVRARVRNHLKLKLRTDLLERMSHRDGLTQIANRRLFDETLQREAQRHVRNGLPLGLIMLDIDFFKRYNDNYGHGLGDECLIAVATALQQVVRRSSDLLARYGGEEFVAILPETDREGVRKVAEDMRSAIEALQIEHGFSAAAAHVTISVGGAVAPLGDVGSAERLLAMADQALYAAKEQGRNRVVIADPVTLPLA